MIPTYVDYNISFVSIKSVTKSYVKDLKKLGFKFNVFHTKCKKKIINEEQLISLFQTLNDLNICFAIGKEWNPSETFEYYREKGFLNGKYKQISWIEKNKYIIMEK